MMTADKYYQIVKDTVKKAFEEFAQHPFEWTANEIEAQVRVYNLLHKYYESNKNEKSIIKVQVENDPIPSYNEYIHPVRLELKVKDCNGDIKRPDISIVNDKFGECMLAKDSKSQLLKDAIDCFIELKIGWGYSKGQFSGDGIIKDLRFLGMYNSKGYLIYFLGNQYGAMKEEDLEEYKETLKKHQMNYGFTVRQVFIVFRDRVVDGEFNEIQF